jgi:uncharacterized protein (DUF1330 family)
LNAPRHGGRSTDWLPPGAIRRDVEYTLALPVEQPGIGERVETVHVKRWASTPPIITTGESTMPKGYWIARVDVADLGKYQAYIVANALPFKMYGARFLVRGGRFENVEGSSRSRNVVLEFVSYQTALDCWNSAAYQAALKLRQPVSTADVIIIEGHDEPQEAGR